MSSDFPAEVDATVDPDSVALAFLATASAAFEDLPSVRVLDRGPEVVALLTGQPAPTLNGVWVGVPGPDLERLASALEGCAASGLPFCVQLRPETDPAAVALVARSGLVAAFEMPLMVRPGSTMSVPDVPGLQLVRLAPEEAWRHAAVLSESMELPREIADALVTPDVLRHPAVRTYVGTLDGADVVTAVGLVAGGAVGVFNVGTVTAVRGRGLGGAATARAVADGLAAGAGYALLQSSEMGFGLYRSLGFEVVEQWQVWVHEG